MSQPASANTSRKGGCLCGAVRYEVKGEPVMAGFCHCLSCRKLSGSGHAFHAMVPEDAFTVAGEARSFAWTADSGNKVTTSFCPKCGSPLFGRSSGFPGTVTFRVASLDDPSAIAPQMTVYSKRLLGWDHLDSSLPAFPGMLPKPDAG